MGKIMRRFIMPLLVAIAMLALVSKSASGDVKAEEAPTSVKDDSLKFNLPDLEGQMISHQDEKFKNKVVLVDIWGTWCGPCRSQVPSLVKMQEKYKDKGFEIVGIAFERGAKSNYDKNVEKVKKFAEEYKINYTLLVGSKVKDDLPDVVEFVGYPTGILIGRDGKVKKIDVGFGGDESADKLEKTIVELLGDS